MTLISKVKKLLKNEGIKYLISSCIAFAINFVILVALEWLLKDKFLLGAELAMVCAWIASSIVNFFINRYWVFSKGSSFAADVSKYYTLALPVFIVKNFGILELLYRCLKLPMIVASPIAEVILFVSNYFIQKKLIFKDKKGEKNG